MAEMPIPSDKSVPANGSKSAPGEGSPIKMPPGEVPANGSVRK